MATSTRFAVAVHVLAALALHGGTPVASQHLAKSASSNASVIRRILSLLAEAGLTTAQLGQGGGALLAKAPETIRLLDVFRAVEDCRLVAMHRDEPDRTCYVGRNVQTVLGEAVGEAETAFFDRLAESTIQDIADGILARRDGEGGEAEAVLFAGGEGS